MKFNIDEKNDYQQFIINYLVSNNGFIQRSNKDFNPYYAMDVDCLFDFLYNTQPEKMESLEKIHKTELRDTLINFINNAITQKNSNLVDVLKHGIEIDNIPLDLMYTKPATSYNKDLIKKYEENIFSVAEEVYASETERVDLVVFLNGFAIISFELKSNTQGQSYEDAIYQYRTHRNPNDRLFLFKAGCFVNFAMDLEEVYMTTKLTGDDTVFLPFNMGDGNGIYSGSGNPIFEDKYSVSYMWEDVLRKDSILELISKFIFIEVKEKRNELNGKNEISETLIFPRYHQRDAVHKLLDDVLINKSDRNYLIQHSAGSGKTNTIAWLAYRLSSLHDENNEIIFDNIIVVTDRVVVDRQLQAAIRGMEHKSGLIRVMDDKCNSQDLAIALNSNTKIIATTIQKFPYIVDNVADLKDKKFAVIIDEAHSSTAGKEMAAVTKVLGKNSLVDVSSEDLIIDEIKRHGKQSNVSMFAFTATPKPTTLNLFGKTNKHGQKEAFHMYSMKQAIEEGFILDVLQNYITYDTYYKLNKEIEEDPNCKTSDAKRQIARFIELHETNINQRIEIIVEHFRNNVMHELEGKAKAMVITPSREAAVKYYQAFKSYIGRMNYTDVQPLVAFSGKVSIDDEEYTEVSINGFSEDKLPNEFDKDNYQVLLVANKYQAGFDQPKLCAMYVLKKLKGVNAVQTLSRLNRICPPYDKKTFILDFKNSYEDIENAFSVYYDRTLLPETVNPHGIYDIEAEIDGYNLIDEYDVNIVNELIYKPKITSIEKNKLRSTFQRTKRNLEKLPIEEQNEFIKKMKSFVRFYEFLLQASRFEDVELHKKYNFIICLLAFVNIKHPGNGYDLDGKISAMNFVQKKTSEHTKEEHISKPIVTLPTTGVGVLNEDKELKLSEIIAEINARTGKNFDNDVTIKAILQIRDLLVKSDELKIAAKNNTESDFEFKFFEVLDEALIDGINVNNDFFTLLLNDDDTKKEVLGIFAKDIYKELKESG